MASKNVEVRGDKMLAATMARAAHELGDMEQAAGSAGRLIQTRARGQAPKRTGRLASSLRSKADGSDVEVVSGLVYAPVIHNGWAGHGISPHPFLVPVAHASEPVWRGYYTAELKTIYAQVKGA